MYRVLPVYISHICGRHNSELSGGVPVITWKVRLQDVVPYHLVNMISRALAVRYGGIHDVGRQTDLIHVFGDHVSVLPA